MHRLQQQTISGFSTARYPGSVLIKFGQTGSETVSLVSDAVDEFVLANFSTTSLSFSWTLTPIAALIFTGYNISCRPLLEGIPPPEPLVREQRVTVATVTNLYPGVGYSCVIVVFSHTETSLLRRLTHTTAETGRYTIHLILSGTSTYVTLNLHFSSSCRTSWDP